MKKAANLEPRRACSASLRSEEVAAAHRAAVRAFGRELPWGRRPRRGKRAPTFIRHERTNTYGAPMQFSTGVDEPVAHLADRFLRLVAEGRGDGARGRNLYALRCLDAMGSADGPLHLPYRPTRNPAAFLAMVFDLAGDAIHGYHTRLDGGAMHAREASDAVHGHLVERLLAPWTSFAAELHGAGFTHLATLICETVLEALQRPAVSDLPAVLEELRSWMTAKQTLVSTPTASSRPSLPRVLTLLRFDARRDSTAATVSDIPRGELRALVRGRFDRPWRRTAERVGRGDPIASSPGAFELFVAHGARHGGTSASPTRRPRTRTAPVVTRPPLAVRQRPAPPASKPERRAPGVVAERREARLQRWGVSATYPSSTTIVDDRLAREASDVPAFHAGAAGRTRGRPSRRARGRSTPLLQRVADALMNERPGTARRRERLRADASLAGVRCGRAGGRDPSGAPRSADAEHEAAEQAHEELSRAFTALSAMAAGAPDEALLALRPLLDTPLRPSPFETALEDVGVRLAADTVTRRSCRPSSSDGAPTSSFSGGAALHGLGVLLERRTPSTPLRPWSTGPTTSPSSTLPHPSPSGTVRLRPVRASPEPDTTATSSPSGTFRTPARQRSRSRRRVARTRVRRRHPQRPRPGVRERRRADASLDRPRDAAPSTSSVTDRVRRGRDRRRDALRRRDRPRGEDLPRAPRRPRGTPRSSAAALWRQLARAC